MAQSFCQDVPRSVSQNQTRDLNVASITITDRATYPSNEAAGASCPRPPITLQVAHSNRVARSNKPITIFDLCMNAR